MVHQVRYISLMEFRHIRKFGPLGLIEIASKELFSTDDYIPPKKPYSFTALLDDILHFAAEVLVDDGRLTIWMPTANDEIEFAIPKSPYLRLSSQCVQVFSKCKVLKCCLTHVLNYSRVENTFDICQAPWRTNRSRYSTDPNNVKRNQGRRPERFQKASKCHVLTTGIELMALVFRGFQACQSGCR